MATDLKAFMKMVVDERDVDDMLAYFDKAKIRTVLVALYVSDEDLKEAGIAVGLRRSYLTGVQRYRIGEKPAIATTEQAKKQAECKKCAALFSCLECGRGINKNAFRCAMCGWQELQSFECVIGCPLVAERKGRKRLAVSVDGVPVPASAPAPMQALPLAFLPLLPSVDNSANRSGSKRKALVEAKAAAEEAVAKLNDAAADAYSKLMAAKAAIAADKTASAAAAAAAAAKSK